MRCYCVPPILICAGAAPDCVSETNQPKSYTNRPETTLQVLAELVQGMVADDPPAKADAVIAEVRLLCWHQHLAAFVFPTARHLRASLCFQAGWQRLQRLRLNCSTLHSINRRSRRRRLSGAWRTLTWPRCAPRAGLWCVCVGCLPCWTSPACSLCVGCLPCDPRHCTCKE